jgi:hypothetical protein
MQRDLVIVVQDKKRLKANDIPWINREQGLRGHQSQRYVCTVMTLNIRLTFQVPQQATIHLLALLALHLRVTTRPFSSSTFYQFQSFRGASNKHYADNDLTLVLTWKIGVDHGLTSSTI